MGLAPTTSTTMQMALGDALAVALLTRRGFTAADFRQFHPGGRLGTRLRRVRELMHAGDAMPLAPPDTADGPRPAADHRKALRLPRASSTPPAGWSASSPTATCAAPWGPTCCRGRSATS